jgi:hypothetical protein
MAGDSNEHIAALKIMAKRKAVILEMHDVTLILCWHKHFMKLPRGSDIPVYAWSYKLQRYHIQVADPGIRVLDYDKDFGIKERIAKKIKAQYGR